MRATTRRIGEARAHTREIQTTVQSLGPLFGIVEPVYDQFGYWRGSDIGGSDLRGNTVYVYSFFSPFHPSL